MIVYIMIPPVMSSSAISPPVPAGVDAPAAAVPTDASTTAPAAPGISDPVSPASIVNLSEEAQLLSAAGAVPSAAMATVAANPVISAADPAIAAAIAAYHLGDGLFSGTVDKPEENPPETGGGIDINLAPVPAVEASALDLHDSARDDAANGVAWNWMRVHPVQRNLTKR